MTQPQRSSAAANGGMLSPEFLHDLRTPLNHIIGFCEMLTEQAQEEGQVGFMPDLQNIHSAARQLLALLNNGVPTVLEEAPQDSRPTAGNTPDLLRSDAVTTPGALQALILVVDDNKMNREMLSQRLERQGHGVQAVNSGHQAMEALRAQAYDLVLLDIRMPVMDGYAVLKEIKDDEELCHIPVIMISALDELHSVVRCIELGAEDYLPKPFEPTLLKARIGACLGKKRAHDREMHLFNQLQQNYQSLQKLEKLRDDLTHMIVHDLRTPLCSVIAGMQTLEAVGKLDETQSEMVEIAIGGGEMLLGMINDLLDVEKLESGSMQLDYSLIVAAKLVSDATSQVSSLCKDKNLTLVTQIASNLKPFRGDDNKLRRVLVNLLGNAIKFTPAGGVLTIDARLSQHRQSLVFSVSDTGEGIPFEAFQRIFEKFGQVESRKGGRTMSTGLGLTFCKLAVEAHGGSIQVDSMPGEGSVFSFMIPLTSDDVILPPPLVSDEAEDVDVQLPTRVS